MMASFQFDDEIFYRSLNMIPFDLRIKLIAARMEYWIKYSTLALE
jgi:hypothetical protein